MIYYITEFEDFADFIEIEIDEDDELNFSNIKDRITAQPERHLLISTYLMLDSANDKYYNWDNQYNDNKILNTVYDFIAKFVKKYKVRQHQQGK